VTVIYSLKNVVKERLIDGVGFRLLVPEIQIRAQENIALKNVVKERLIDGVGFRLLVPEIQIRA